MSTSGTETATQTTAETENTPKTDSWSPVFSGPMLAYIDEVARAKGFDYGVSVSQSRFLALRLMLTYGRSMHEAFGNGQKVLRWNVDTDTYHEFLP